ncbi:MULTISPECIES: protein translocase subunit SecD [unclassified Chelatococcus]|jgi:protein-export membrane protein SecD|uniref:protein translocase subunit SecD n=1 Tax=unclassified Chelatococcus TaxID=2638111 RepID=UPI001BCB1DB9|nr:MULTISPECIES: protein translocase subunit SecD [unclassified Chelatococcus]CAH1670050.1 Protein translocase subunit SecD [Hyphomicrobiales bacterium]MBS7738288.1 protein translocase subunit SecD [Chelatococcus sp. HY11]MBX3545816.1 protein translocase subunit SecD [Chelatococcus sp.]MCO5077366.1 protein translocase subunit SecD [Chelatococcus sp.]CAH1677716.1 Protein translocase subunit SecD [Hyphomicrobiales bacterium]
MLRYSKAKIISILLLTLLGFAYAAPNLFSETTRERIAASVPGWIPAWIVPHRAMVLGLDLQGGSHVVLEVDENDLIRTQVNSLRDDVRRILRETRIAPQGGIVALPRGMQMRVPSEADRQRLLARLNELARPAGNAILGTPGNSTINVSEGADGLIQVTLTDVGVTDRVRRAVDQTIEVLRRRVDALGTTEPNIQREGAGRVLVQVPGLQDPQRLKDILGRTAKLQFRFIAEGGASPGDVDMIPSRDNAGQPVPVERRVIVEGEDLTDAQPAFDSQTSQPIVNFRFNLRGAQRFGQATSEGVGRLLAIVLDNEVISAPRIQTPITGGQGQISGSFSVQQANDLAVLLRAGALPAKLTIVEERTVGPGLGQDSIEAGTMAIYVATIFVALFMLATYGLFGIFANIALLVHVVFILALMSLLGATLTLPGIAGIVLTIGTAVDSNVLIYERIREEAHGGRSIISAIDAGFTRAFATIFDSNSTMLIAALILFFLGSGPVRGFAVVFILGILTTVITAVTMTRMMIALWYRVARPKQLPF